VHHNFVASYVWAIPFDRAFRGGPKRLTQGWQMQGITRFATGFPIHMNQSVGDTSLTGSSATDMPDLVGPIHIMNPRTSAAQMGSYLYFDPSSFVAAPLIFFCGAEDLVSSPPPSAEVPVRLSGSTARASGINNRSSPTSSRLSSGEDVSPLNCPSRPNRSAR